MLDLSALEVPTVPLMSMVAPRAPIDRFEEDPDQPRTEFVQGAEWDAFVADIEERGVLQPVICREHPNGKLRIRFGAKRYRASKQAGLPDLPYLITADPRQFDDYSQVSENERRSPLTPKDLANFIAKKLREGEKRKAIASKLGVDASHVTHLLALIDAPAFITELYESGRCRTPLYLWQLRKLHQEAPELVEQRVAQTAELDRSAVADLTHTVRQPTITGPPMEHGASQSTAALGAGFPAEQTPSCDAPVEQRVASPREGVAPRLRKPLLFGRRQGRAVLVLLTKRPSSAGLIWIRHEDEGCDQEVAVGEISISLLTDAARRVDHP